MAATKLQAVRHQLDYSAANVIDMLIRRAHALGIPMMSASSLKTKLSRWENGREQVSLVYQRLFRDVYGRTNEELGFPPEPEDEESDDLLTRIKAARSVDASLVEGFRRQVDHFRHVDRRFGGVTQLDQLRGTITQLQRFLGYSTVARRAELAVVLAEASALAGWEALDRNAVTSAWDHHESAKAAAREAESPALLAHATAQQAFILIDMGEPELAVEQLGAARSMAEGLAPALMRSWLAAALGEGLAAAGRRDEALRAFDWARCRLPNDPVDPALPYLFLGGAHLDRWRGNALSKLGDVSAIDELSHALPRLPADFVRARVGMLTDLAYAYAAAGDREAALTHARQGRRLAKQIKSDRQLRRLSGLILPTGGRGAA